jgi:hypothetical protein
MIFVTFRSGSVPADQAGDRQPTMIVSAARKFFTGAANLWTNLTLPNGSRITNAFDDDENRLIEMRTDTYYTPEGSRWKTEWVYDGLDRARIRKEYLSYCGSWYLSGETRYIYTGAHPRQAHVPHCAIHRAAPIPLNPQCRFGRTIRNAFIRDVNVVGGIPSSRAAP